MGAATGSELLITLSYDDGALDLDPTSMIARYEPSSFRLAASLLGGASVFEASLGSITVVGTGVLGPALHITATLPDGDAVFFLFRDDDRSFLSSQALPTHFGTLLDWDQIDLSVVDMPAMWPATINPIDVEIIAVVVPEPTTAASLLCGFSLFALRRRRYQPRANKITAANQLGPGSFHSIFKRFFGPSW